MMIFLKEKQSFTEVYQKVGNLKRIEKNMIKSKSFLMKKKKKFQKVPNDCFIIDMME